MNRRGFMGSILALGAAPAIVRADSLMRIVPKAADVLLFRRPIPLNRDAWVFTERELELSLDQYSRFFIVPAMRKLAEGIDRDILARLEARA